MTLNGWLQILFFFALILAVTKPLGIFITRVFNRERTFLDPMLRPIERLIYRLTGVDEQREMRWTEYAVAMLLFSVVSMLVLYALQRLQAYLPFNPQQLGNIDPSSSFNTAASFTTNTNWQSYVPETTMSYLTQMAGLAYHNFVSAAVGIALAI
ncbi:MAG: potassium-transporting ATPase subunit KdpA, partial [Blastocatellia bacterium]|nr:potassium-transporting ATPase subunit KdpA [Blastocatellia bacterium]